MSEYVPTPEQVNAFKAAWHDADDDGQAGKRVEIALAEVLGPALATARREGQVEALRAAANTDDPDHDTEVALGGSDYVHVWLHARANRIENGADQ